MITFAFAIVLMLATPGPGVLSAAGVRRPRRRPRHRLVENVHRREPSLAADDGGRARAVVDALDDDEIRRKPRRRDVVARRHSKRRFAPPPTRARAR